MAMEILLVGNPNRRHSRSVYLTFVALRGYAGSMAKLLTNSLGAK